MYLLNTDEKTRTAGLSLGMKGIRNIFYTIPTFSIWFAGYSSLWCQNCAGYESTDCFLAFVFWEHKSAMIVKAAAFKPGLEPCLEFTHHITDT